MVVVTAIALALWLAVMLPPWQAWRCRERLEPALEPTTGDDLTILVPARNEALTIAETLRAAHAAAPRAALLVVDDDSEDATAEYARATGIAGLKVLSGAPPPTDWVGKLWALEQGLGHVASQRVLLLDADIRLAPGMVAALERKADKGYALVSALAQPCWDGRWARTLLPAFVYFFKLLYPFALANRPGGSVAAAAGGVMLVQTSALHNIGAFAAWRSAIIDDCTLAAQLKRGGYRCWLGLTHGAVSHRRQNLASIIAMVARSAYVALRESPLLLAIVTSLMLLLFWVPLAATAFASPVRWLGVATWATLALSYLPTLLYYGRNPIAALLLPAVATFYLGATWYSALRAWTGTRSAWKGRRYTRVAR